MESEEIIARSEIIPIKEDTEKVMRSI